MSSNDTSFELCCFLLKGKPEETFSIRVVSDLKVAQLVPDIKRAYDQLATNGMLSNIALYKVDTTIDELAKLEDPPENCYPLLLISDLKDYWPDPEQIDKNRIQLLVKAEVVAIQPRKESVEPISQSSSEIGQLTLRQDSTAKGFRYSPPSAYAASYEDFQAQQESVPIYNGRPFVRTGTPIELFHPAFDLFTTRLEQIDNLPASQFSKIEDLMHASQKFCDSDSDRWGAIDHLIAGAILSPVNQDEMFENELGGVVFTDYESSCRPYRAFIEVSAEIGGDSFDPAIKGAQTYARCWSQEKMTKLRQASPCPSLIISITGPWICVFGAVYLEHVIVQPLTDYVWMGRHPQRVRHQMRVARIFRAISTTLAALEEYYAPLVKSDSTPAMDRQRFFPSIRSVQTSDGLVHFSYKRRVGAPMFLRSLFEATTEDGRRIVVKFTESYHFEAHKLLSDRCLAPKLLSLRAEPVAGNLLMIVMELSGTSLDRYLASHPELDSSTLDRVRSDVKDALEILHAHHLVFGDLRQPNVLVTGELRGQLVDFDWCGRNCAFPWTCLVSSQWRDFGPSLYYHNHLPPPTWSTILVEPASKPSCYGIRTQVHVVLRTKEFILTKSQIEFDSPNYFTACFLGDFREAQTKRLELTRDPDLFKLIMEHICGYEVIPLDDVVLRNLRADALFYQLEGLVKSCDAMIKRPKTRTSLTEIYLVIGYTTDNIIIDETNPGNISVTGLMCITARMKPGHAWTTLVTVETLSQMGPLQLAESHASFSGLEAVSGIETFAKQVVGNCLEHDLVLMGWRVEVAASTGKAELLVILKGLGYHKV